MTNLQPFLEFVIERHRIYERRRAGNPAPWTNDPILQKYRFCNIYRSLDRVTVWINENVRIHVKDSPHLVTAMSACRLINRPETINRLIPNIVKHGWNEECEGILRSVAGAGEPITNAAYMITTPEGMDKAAGISFMISDIHRRTRGEEYASLKGLADHLMQSPRIGTFLAAQIVADCKETPHFLSCPDWHEFALSGPGSRRGLNYIYGRDFESPWEESDWHKHLLAIRENLNKFLKANKLPPMDAQCSQNCCCEAQKYFRMKLGVAEPKQLFRPQAEAQTQASFI